MTSSRRRTPQTSTRTPPSPGRHSVTVRSEAAATDPVWQRLTDQIAWYSARSRFAQRAYELVKLDRSSRRRPR